MSQAKRIINKARWPELSPLLDELLDLDLSARASRLMALHRQDPELAADLAELLARQAKQEAADYLATPLLGLAAHTLAAGQLVGAYTLVREIGHGGMGAVWLARRTDGRFEGEVAIKFLSAGLVGPGDAGRFAREGQILARLAHPHIARLLDAGLAAESKAPYLVLEYIAGQPIDQYCDSRGLDTRARVLLFRDVLAAVAHAHTRLILHRDLKPSNILVTANGEVKLLDFGIAKLLEASDEAGAAAGGAGTGSATSAGAASELTQQAGRAFTPRYAAPEQVQGSEVTTATDVYALGVLLYLLLSGRHPTATHENDANTTPLERMRGIVEVEPKKLSDAVRGKSAEGKAQDLSKKRTARELRGDLDTIVAKALKKVPAERYANAAALSEELRRWLAHEPISARPDSAYYRTAKFVRRHRWGVAAGTFASLAVAAGAGLAVWKAQEAHEQRMQAESLIEFMLGDLRKKLEPVGRLDVLDAVGEKALGYYSQQDARSASADSLGRQARALHLLGEMANARGELNKAEQLFRQAQASTAELLSRSPHDAQRIFDHAQSVYWVGYSARRLGRIEEAESQFSSYKDLAERLIELSPGKLEWQMEYAHANANLGILRLETKRAQQAIKDFDTAIAVWEPLAARSPEANLELARAFGWQAKGLEASGQLLEALAAQEKKLAALEREHDKDGDARKRFLQANASLEISQLALALGRTEMARQSSMAAISKYQALLALEPDKVDWQGQYCLAQLYLTEVLLAQQAAADARKARASSSPLLNRLVQRELASAAIQVKLKGLDLINQVRLAKFEAGAPPVADLRAYLESLAPFESKGKILRAEHVLVVAEVELQMGEVSQSAELASKYWRQAEKRIQPIAASGDLSAMALQGIVKAKLGKHQEAQEIAEVLHGTRYRHPRFSTLTGLVKEAPGR